MNLWSTSIRLVPVIWLALLAGCKTAPPNFTDAQFQYTVQPSDTLVSVVAQYQKKGVDVWDGAIQIANPSLTDTTNLSPHTTIIIPARNCIEPKLIEPIEFDGYTVSQISTPLAAQFLMKQKLRGNSNDFLKSSNGVAVVIETVQQYKEADKTNNCAVTTVDMMEQANMQLVEDKLEFMAKAQPSPHSYLGDDYLKYLPVDVLTSSLNASEGDVSDKYEKILKSDAEKGKMLKNYTEFFAPLHITKIKEGSNTLSFYDATMEIDYAIREIGRGDVDGDGNEDALIEIGWHTQGTMGGSFTSVLTRTGPDQKVKWVGK